MADEPTQVWNALLLVLLGWCLGLLGPAIIETVRKRYRNKEIRAAILAELHEVRHRLAATISLFESRFGTFDRKFLEWLLPILKDYKGPNPSADAIESIEKLLALTNEQLAALGKRAQAPVGGALGIKKHAVRYLDSRLADLGGFSERAQALLLDIRTRIDLYNEEVDQIRYFFQLTYQSGISPENHAQASQLVVNGYVNLGKQARQIIEHIESLRTT